MRPNFKHHSAVAGISRAEISDTSDLIGLDLLITPSPVYEMYAESNRWSK